MKSNKTHTILIMGLALFATFFGAGNLIFPPYLGREAGTDWFIGFLGFFLVDVGMGVLAILATVYNRRGDIQGVVGKIGAFPGKVMATIIILCIGPGLVIPRTAATTYEMGISKLMPGSSIWLFSAIFFVISLALTIRPNKVVDIVGKYLTPVLVAVLVVLMVIGVASPLGEASAAPEIVPLKEGILSGYQTMDGIGALLLTGIVTSAAMSKGYTDKKEVSGMVALAGIIAGVLLMIVYCGLTYLGATTSSIESFAAYEQAGLLMAIVQALMGKYGAVLLTIIVFLACLTTAVGLTSVASDYFHEISGGKLKYTHLVIVITVISFVISNMGLSSIIRFSGPILGLLYPPVLVLVLLTFFDEKLQNDNIACFAAYGAFLISVLEWATSYWVPFGFVKSLPLAEFWCAWVVPAVICGIIGACFKRKANA